MKRNFPFFVAWRYFFSKKSTNIINILSGLSLLGVLLSTTALVIVISVFNGFQEQIITAYNPTSPDIRIEAKKGKSFVNDSTVSSKIQNISEVEALIPVVSERVVLEFNSRILVAKALGVPDDVQRVYSLDSLMKQGTFYTHYSDQNYAIVGYPLAARMQMNMFSGQPFSIYALRQGKTKSRSVTDAFNKRYIHPSGYFEGDLEFSANHLFIGFDFARELFAMQNRISYWDLKLKKNADLDKVSNQISKIIGESFVVKNRFELNETLFRMLKIEKFFVYATLLLIFLIASFNIVGALSMIISDKKKDIDVIQKLGATRKITLRIFLIEAFLISNIGTILGLIFGVVVCLLQQKFGLLMMQVSYGALPFPVVIEMTDIFMVLSITLAISFFIAWISVKQIFKSVVNKK